MTRPGMAGRGGEGQGKALLARNGEVRLGTARHGGARQGWHGKTFVGVTFTIFKETSAMAKQTKKTTAG